MKGLELLVFDLDGTLVRSGADIALAVNHTLAALGSPPLEARQIEGFVGDGVEALLTRALGPQGAGQLDRARDLYAAHYAAHLLDQTTLYPGVPEALRHFHRRKKIIVTNKRQAWAAAIAKGLGIEGYFLAIIGEDTTPYRKPDRRLFAQVVAPWGVPPDRTVVIGDGINDILLAKQAGAVSCAFLNGLTPRDRLLALAPDLQYESLPELAALIE